MTGTDCGLFTHKSVPVIFEPPCTSFVYHTSCVFDYPPTYLVCLHNGDDTP